MPDIQTFNDFVISTRDARMTPADQIINDAIRNTWGIRDMLYEMDVKRVVQGGNKVKDLIQFRNAGTYRDYNPNDEMGATLSNLLTEQEAAWSFAANYWGYTEHELEQNEGDEELQFKNLRDNKRNACRADTFEAMDNALFATPVSTMESGTLGAGQVRRPHSLFSFITEDGLAPSALTTVLGIDPDDEEEWRNPVETYDATNAASIAETLPTAFQGMFMALHFESPKPGDSAFNETLLRKKKIWTNNDGFKIYKTLTDNSNDRLVPLSNDLGNNAVNVGYGGIPVQWKTGLNAKGWTTGQPRFMWIDFTFIYPIFKRNRFMKELDPMRASSKQPFSWIVWTDIWWQLWCRSRKRGGGIIKPA